MAPAAGIDANFPWPRVGAHRIGQEFPDSDCDERRCFDDFLRALQIIAWTLSGKLSRSLLQWSVITTDSLLWPLAFILSASVSVMDSSQPV
ncbi:hypothetical protein MTO96_041394 [Rhipicephalus appendiculatus]